MMKQISSTYNDFKNNLNIPAIWVEAFYFSTVLVIYLVIFIINYLGSGSFFPDGDTTWFWSGLVMLVFSLYYIEPYFTAPTNVFANAFALFLVVLSLSADDFGSSFWRLVWLFVLFGIIGLSLLSKIMYDKDKSEDFIINRLTKEVNVLLGIIGSGKVLYSITFLYFLFLNIFNSTLPFSNWYLFTIFFLFCILLILPPKFIRTSFTKLFQNKDINRDDNIGKIFSVQSDKVFLVKLFDDKKIEKFTSICFRHEITNDDKNNISVGYLFDIYYLDNQKWGKLIKVQNIPSPLDHKIDKDYVYHLSPDGSEDKMERFVGVVHENSSIDKIYFEYSQRLQKLEVDDLLELEIRDKKVFYQVVNASTKIEKLEGYNEKGSIVSEAIQLGCWDKKSMSFNKLGWVPLVNEPIYIANTTNEESELNDLQENELSIGVIPKTQLPSIIKIDEAISHHMAILGVTGSGKSVLARKIIKNIQHKKIVVDLTAEWKKQFNNQEFIEINQNNLQDFLQDTDKDNKIGILELKEISGTGAVLSEVQLTLENIFKFCKDQYEQNKTFKITIVLEEAHTIIPETSFLGDLGDYGSNKAVVNKLSQIALQGRKYGVGLLVIGQRSANISKTVLTQCNTIVAFKAFDDTSYGFLTNYFGTEIIKAIPNLKNYHAIVYGNGIKSNNPVIIDTYDSGEEITQDIDNEDFDGLLFDTITEQHNSEIQLNEEDTDLDEIPF